jgi:hypothetical protein
MTQYCAKDKHNDRGAFIVRPGDIDSGDWCILQIASNLVWKSL